MSKKDSRVQDELQTQLQQYQQEGGEDPEEEQPDPLDRVLNNLDGDYSVVAPGSQEQNVQVTQEQVPQEQVPQEQVTQEQTHTQHTQHQSADAQGNLVDQQGNIVARSGAERRHYESAQQARRALQEAHTQIASLTQQLETTSKETSAYKQAGLNNDELDTSIKLMQAWKTNPVNTIRYLVQQGLNLGYNINDLVGQGQEGQEGQTQGQGQGQLLQQLTHLIDQKLQPFTRQYESERAQEQATQEAQLAAQKEVSTFYTAHPDAQQHDGLLGILLQADQSLSLDGAYWQLRNYATHNRLDWNRPLAPQIQELQQRNQTTQEVNKPFVRGAGNAFNSHTTDESVEFADPETPYDNIIADAMRQTG